MPSIPDKNKTNIGWIGTGIMGAPMCGHIISGGYSSFVYNRSREKAVDLIYNGAVWCDSPTEVAEKSDIIFTIVGHPSDVRNVYFGDEGIFGADVADKILVDMTTTEPSLAVEIYNRGKEQNAYAVDAPVSGGDIGAKNAKLSIMVGGEKEIVELIMPLLSLLGHQIVYEGGPGAGQHTKMCNQITVASIMIGICEALVYCQKAGLDEQTMIKTICAGAGSSWLMENLAPKIAEGDYDPGFMVDHIIKDLGIAISEAEKMNLKLPGLELAKNLYDKTKELGHGRLGTQALILALKELK